MRTTSNRWWLVGFAALAWLALRSPAAQAQGLSDTPMTFRGVVAARGVVYYRGDSVNGEVVGENGRKATDRPRWIEYLANGRVTTITLPSLELCVENAVAGSNSSIRACVLRSRVEFEAAFKVVRDALTRTGPLGCGQDGCSVIAREVYENDQAPCLGTKPPVPPRSRSIVVRNGKPVCSSLIVAASELPASLAQSASSQSALSTTLKRSMLVDPATWDVLYETDNILARQTAYFSSPDATPCTSLAGSAGGVPVDIRNVKDLDRIYQQLGMSYDRGLTSTFFNCVQGVNNAVRFAPITDAYIFAPSGRTYYAPGIAVGSQGAGANYSSGASGSYNFTVLGVPGQPFSIDARVNLATFNPRSRALYFFLRGSRGAFPLAPTDFSFLATSSSMGAMAAVTSNAIQNAAQRRYDVVNNFAVDARFITGSFILQNDGGPAITVGYDPTANPPTPGDTVSARWPNAPTDHDSLGTGENVGLLTKLAQHDARDTTIYVFRGSDGALLGKRWGLTDRELGCAEQAKTNLSESQFKELCSHVPVSNAPSGQITAVVRGVGTQLPFTSSPALNFQIDYDQKLSKEGEQGQVQGQVGGLSVADGTTVVVINHATGYLGSARISSTVGAAMDVGTIVMRPPNLKIWAERKRDDKQEFIVGSEGAGLLKDVSIIVYTEWLAEDGTTLPSTLPGYTGRLVVSNSAGNGQLAALPVQPPGASTVDTFPITPGFHTHVVKLPAGTPSTAQHFYIHVDGISDEESYRVGEYSKFRVPYGPEFDVNQTCFFSQTTLNNADPCNGRDDDGDGLIDELEGVPGKSCSELERECVERDPNGTDTSKLRSRPWLYTPVKVPFFDAAATQSAKISAVNFGLPPPAPIYKWRYRPEYHFSILDLEVESIKGTKDGQQVDVIRGSLPEEFVELSDLERVDVIYTLTTEDDDELSRLDGDRDAVWMLGDVVAQVDANGHVFFANPGDMAALDGEDFLTLRLVQRGDQANELKSYVRQGIKVHLVGGQTSIQVGEQAEATIKLFPANLTIAQKTYSIIPFTAGVKSKTEKGVRATIDSDSGVIRVSKKSEEGLLRIRAEAKVAGAPSGASPLVDEAWILIGCKCDSCDREGHCEVALGSVDVRISLGQDEVGSSRVDLQACKLEYSIVSPK